MFKEILNEVGLGVKFYEEFREIYGIKDDENPTICFQYPIQRYICDFVDLEKKIIFQVNGDFWHSNPILYDHNNLTKIQKNNLHHDKNKKVYFENLGYKIVDIWESEIYWNRELIKTKILEAINGVFPQREEGTKEVEDWSSRLKEMWFKKGKGRPKTIKIKKECPACHKIFEVNPSKQNRTKYCSNKCYSTDRKKIRIGSRKVERPSKEELDYGVSGSAVRKWLKQYGLSPTAHTFEKREKYRKENTEKKLCSFCGKGFEIEKNQKHKQKRKFCSHFCCEEFLRKDWPSKSEIEGCLKTMTKQEIVKKYNTYGQTFDKWIKRYGIKV
jgi:very-short-patch-repair endonuclease